MWLPLRGLKPWVGGYNQFTPVNSSAALGTDYLGSEHGYIIQGGVSEWQFGSDGGE